MRVVSLVFFEIATVILAVAGALVGLSEFAIASLVLGALPVATFVLGTSALTHATFGLYAAAVAVFGLFHMPSLVCAGAIATALVGWDAALTAPRVADAASADDIRFALRYTARSASLAAIGVLLVYAAGAIRIRLTFGFGLGLSVAVLVLAALFLRSLRRTEAHESEEPPAQP